MLDVFRVRFELLDEAVVVVVGVVAERAFDLAISMREWPEGLPPGNVRAAGEARLKLLSELSGVDARPIWEWSLVQLVWNGLLLAQIGQTASAELEFALADAFTR